MMSSFVLKMIAVVSMLLDHTGYVIFGKFSFMNELGRLAFPLFAFFITEGYVHTHNLKKYFFRLSLCALISQIPYLLFLSVLHATPHFNILFTLLLGLLTITIYERLDKKWLGILLVILACILAQFCYFDYGWFGIAIIFLFHLWKNKKVLMNIGFLVAVFMNYFSKYCISLEVSYLYIIFFCSLALIPINLYNGKKGKDIKYLLYVFYPTHLLVLYFLSFLK